MSQDEYPGPRVGPYEEDYAEPAPTSPALESSMIPIDAIRASIAEQLEPTSPAVPSGVEAVLHEFEATIEAEALIRHDGSLGETEYARQLGEAENSTTIARAAVLAALRAAQPGAPAESRNDVNGDHSLPAAGAPERATPLPTSGPLPFVQVGPNATGTNMPSPTDASTEATADRFAAAVAFAAEAHAGQLYAGFDGRPPEPYILHPLRVALAVREECRVVAVLHDVFEDTCVLAPEWLTDDERAALFTVTRGKSDETYSAYIDRIAGAGEPHGAIAREVKLADIRDNLAHDPPGNLRKRYESALVKLIHDAPPPASEAAE